MGEYTENKEIDAETIYGDELDDEDKNKYSEKLIENAKSFRTFDKALSAFILEHGYVGDSKDIKSMTRFMRNKFEENNVKEVRDLFVSSQRRDREIAYRICFALGLNIKETNDFFRRVMLERGIDFHAVNEIIYYFCIRNGLSYSEARKIIEQLFIIKKKKRLPEFDILYTETIINNVEKVTSKEELITYLEENREGFEYKNATSIRYIKNFWDKITVTEGVAVKEGKLIDKMINPFHSDQSRKGGGDTRDKDIIERDVKREKELMEDDFVVSKEGDSSWIIYCQIIGLDKRQEKHHAHAYDRTIIAPIIEKNVLLPLTADFSFPSRQNIDKIIRGEVDGDYEMYRKILILLVFYMYWANIVTRNNNIFYSMNLKERIYHRDRCRAHIDMYLKDAGYQELYAGNPYDWIFLWSMNDEYPLEAFRAYMREVYIAKEKSEK